jgi:hypothetical protein
LMHSADTGQGLIRQVTWSFFDRNLTELVFRHPLGVCPQQQNLIYPGGLYGSSTLPFLQWSLRGGDGF